MFTRLFERVAEKLENMSDIFEDMADSIRERFDMDDYDDYDDDDYDDYDDDYQHRVTYAYNKSRYCSEPTTIVKREVVVYHEEKVEFFDLYRKLDLEIMNVACPFKKSKKGSGIFLLEKAIKHYGQINGEYEYITMANDLYRIRKYRNELAHSKDSWDYMDDPDYYMTDTLRKVEDMIYYNECNLKNQLVNTKKYLDNRNSKDDKHTNKSKNCGKSKTNNTSKHNTKSSNNYSKYHKNNY